MKWPYLALFALCAASEPFGGSVSPDPTKPAQAVYAVETVIESYTTYSTWGENHDGDSAEQLAAWLKCPMSDLMRLAIIRSWAKNRRSYHPEFWDKVLIAVSKG